MRGALTSPKGELCDTKYLLREGHSETAKCTFVDNRKDPGVKASLMFRHYIPDVSIECVFIMVANPDFFFTNNIVPRYVENELGLKGMYKLNNIFN